MPLVKIDDIDPKELSSLKFFYGVQQEELFLKVMQIPQGEWRNVYFASYMTGGHEKMLNLLLSGVSSNAHIRIFLGDSTIGTTCMQIPDGKKFTKSFKLMLSKLKALKGRCPRLTVYFNNTNHSKFFIVNGEGVFTSQNYGAGTFHSIETGVYFEIKDECIIQNYLDKFEKDFMSDQNTILLFGLRGKSNLMEQITSCPIEDTLAIIKRLLEQIDVGIDDTNYVPETKKWYNSIDDLYYEAVNPLEQIEAFLSEIDYFKGIITAQKLRAAAYEKFGLSFNQQSSTTQYFNTLDEFGECLNNLSQLFNEVREIIDNGQLSDVFELLDELHWETIYTNWVSAGDINGDFLEEASLLQEDCLEESLDSPGEFVFNDCKYSTGLKELKEKYSQYYDMTEPPTPDDLNDYFMYHVFPKASEEIIERISNHEGYADLQNLKDKLERVHSFIEKINTSDLDMGSTLFA